MTYEQVQGLKLEVFRRLCGICLETFAEMVAVLEATAQKSASRKTLNVKHPESTADDVAERARILHVFLYCSIVGRGRIDSTSNHSD